MQCVFNEFLPSETRLQTGPLQVEMTAAMLELSVERHSTICLYFAVAVYCLMWDLSYCARAPLKKEQLEHKRTEGRSCSGVWAVAREAGLDSPHSSRGGGGGVGGLVEAGIRIL